MDIGFSSLTPTAFLMRSMRVFGERTAIIDGEKEFSYREFGDRSLALTGVLADLGISRQDRVAALCANSHVMLELHQAAQSPWCAEQPGGRPDPTGTRSETALGRGPPRRTRQVE